MTNITPENLVKHELIGLNARVVHSSDPALIGKKGIVIDETKNMLVLNDGSKKIKIPKAHTKFHFTLPDAVVEVDGRVLVARPEDRVKKVIKR